MSALLGVVLGSAVAIFAGLALTLVVYLMLPEYRDRLSGEFIPLLKASGFAAVLSASAALAFFSELKGLAWRRRAQVALAAVFAAFVWAYWP